MVDQVLVLMKGGHIRFRRPYLLPSIYSHIEASNSEADSPAWPGPLAARGHIRFRSPYSLPSIYSPIEASNSEADSPARAAAAPWRRKNQFKQRLFKSSRIQCFILSAIFVQQFPSPPCLVTIGVLIKEKHTSQQKKIRAIIFSHCSVKGLCQS